MSPLVDIGDNLREARIRRGLNIKDCEDATKIRGKYLEALEQEDFEVLPGATCVKGFLRSYATFLKLDADGLVDAYKAGYEPRSEEAAAIRVDAGTQKRRSSGSRDTKKKAPRRGQRGYAFVAVVAVVAVALLAWFGTSRGQDAASIGAENISTTTVSTGVSVAGAAGSTSTDTTDGEDSPAGSTSSSAPAATVSTAVNTTGAANGGEAGGEFAVVVNVVDGSCWLVVREDSEAGAEVYAGTLSAGGQQTFKGAKRYWMMVGKPEALTVSVGGRSYTLAEPAGAFVVTEAGVERVG